LKTALSVVVLNISCSFTIKLRDGQRRFSNDIKQEDHKPDLTLINASSSAFNEPNAYSFNIKQQDAKNDSSLIQQDGKTTRSVYREITLIASPIDEFEGKDYYYCCAMYKKENIESQTALLIIVVFTRKLARRERHIEPTVSFFLE